MFALMGAFLLMSAPLAMNASSQRAARKAVRAKSSKTVSKVAKPKQKKVLKETFTVNGVKFVMVQVEGALLKWVPRQTWAATQAATRFRFTQSLYPTS